MKPFNSALTTALKETQPFVDKLDEFSAVDGEDRTVSAHSASAIGISSVGLEITIVCGSE